MADKEPTYYGPVATGGSKATTIGTQTQGSLDCAVLQNLEDYGTYTRSSRTYVERWKAPTSQCINAADGVKIFDADFTPGSVRPDVSKNAKFVGRFGPPALPDKQVWVVDSVRVQQQPAGDHSIVEVSYAAASDGGSEGGSIDTAADLWNVEWRETSMDVLAYCKNTGEAPEWVDFIPGVKNDPAMESGQADTAEATYIRECMNRTNLTQKYCSGSLDTWVRGASIYRLNQHCKDIMAYKQAGMNPHFHYPVVTHQTRMSFPKPEKQEGKPVTTASYPDLLGENLDCVVDLPEGCPYEFAAVGEGENKQTLWKFLKTGDKMEQHNDSGRNYFTRTETWTGARHWNGNFYKGGDSSMLASVELQAEPYKIGEY